MKVGTFGLSRKQVLGKVEKGDSVVCCAGKGDWKIIAFGTTTSDYYLDDKKVFLKEGSFPDRFDFSVEPIPKDRELDLMSIIDRLAFVTNLAYWAVYFRNGIVSLSKQDFDLISKSASAVFSNLQRS